VDAPLAQANLAFPPQAGSLFIGVTNLSTGQRTLNEIHIDPATQSLQDLAASISAVNHVQAVAETQSKTLTILAQPGYAIDFTGRIASAPDTQAITGTTAVQLGGAYTGSKNDQLTFTVQGSGTVGVTPNLTLSVQDSGGHQLASLNIGQGYSPNSALQVGDGVTVQLASGTVNNGDSFTANVVAQPDTAGILSALGLQSFFQGDSAADVSVQPGLLNDPTQLAASTTGQPGDGSNLARLAALQDSPLLAGGSQTLSQFSAALIGQVGTQVKALTQQQTNQSALSQQLQAQQQSVSGVDPNQELVNMIQAQQAFQMSAHYIDVLNQTLSDLIQIVG
jgi:flagellar hook-associated protein 1 FlgK